VWKTKIHTHINNGKNYIDWKTVRGSDTISQWFRWASTIHQTESILCFSLEGPWSYNTGRGTASCVRSILHMWRLNSAVRGERPLRRRDDLRASCCSIWYWHLDIAMVLGAQQPPHNVAATTVVCRVSWLSFITDKSEFRNFNSSRLVKVATEVAETPANFIMIVRHSMRRDVLDDLTLLQYRCKDIKSR